MNPPPSYSTPSYAPVSSSSSFAPPAGYGQSAGNAGQSNSQPPASYAAPSSSYPSSYTYQAHSFSSYPSSLTSSVSPSPSSSSPAHSTPAYASPVPASSPTSYSSYQPPAVPSYQSPSVSYHSGSTPSSVLPSSYSSYTPPYTPASTQAPAHVTSAPSSSSVTPSSTPSYPPNSASSYYSSYASGQSQVQSNNQLNGPAPVLSAHPAVPYTPSSTPSYLPPLNVPGYPQSNIQGQPSPRFRPPPVELPPAQEIQPPLDSVFNQVRPVNPFVGDDGRAISRPPPATLNSFAPKGQSFNYRDPYASEENTPDRGSPSNSQRQVHQSTNQMSGPSQASQKKVDRIDPKQIPRPAEIRGNVIKYFTRSGQIPPPALSDYQVVDEGNCSPRFVRLTTNHFAAESELIDQTKLCIGAIIQPLAPLGDGEEPISVIDYPNGPLRCSRCMAYVNPFFQFIDQGNNFICNICNMKNEGKFYFLSLFCFFFPFII
jgi:protein transport protein SEC24